MAGKLFHINIITGNGIGVKWPIGSVGGSETKPIGTQLCCERDSIVYMYIQGRSITPLCFSHPQSERNLYHFIPKFVIFVQYKVISTVFVYTFLHGVSLYIVL